MRVGFDLAVMRMGVSLHLQTAELQALPALPLQPGVILQGKRCWRVF